MKRMVFRIPVLAPILLFCTVAAQAADYEIHSISHRNYDSMFFEPDYLEVMPGDTVSFVVSDADHQPQSTFVPEGAGHWQAEQGKSITITVSQQGVYVFDCAFHKVMGMAGVLVVGNPVNLDQARQFLEDYRKRTFAINKERLEGVLHAVGAEDD